MMDLTAIAQSSPGAIAVNASILVGYRVAGRARGAADRAGHGAAAAGHYYPSFPCFTPPFGSNAYVNMAMSGMLAGVAAVICDVVLTMGGAC